MGGRLVENRMRSYRRICCLQLLQAAFQFCLTHLQHRAVIEEQMEHRLAVVSDKPHGCGLDPG